LQSKKDTVADKSFYRTDFEFGMVGGPELACARRLLTRLTFVVLWAAGCHGEHLIARKTPGFLAFRESFWESAPVVRPACSRDRSGIPGDPCTLPCEPAFLGGMSWCSSARKKSRGAAKNDGAHADAVLAN